MGSTQLSQVQRSDATRQSVSCHCPPKPSLDHRTCSLWWSLFCPHQAVRSWGSIFKQSGLVIFLSQPTPPGSHLCSGGAEQESLAGMLGTHRINPAGHLPGEGLWSLGSISPPCSCGWSCAPGQGGPNCRCRGLAAQGQPGPRSLCQCPPTPPPVVGGWGWGEG